MVRRVLGDSSVLIANSRNTAQLLRSDWQQEAPKVQILNPGVDTSRFVPAPDSGALRERLGWPSRRVVLTVGRLQRRKGHDIFIEALGAIRRRVPDILYAIVGAGPERQRLEGLVRQASLEGHVQFLGEVSDEDLIACYQACDLFVLPNRDVDGDIEGFGIVLLEAQARGKPVLAGDSGGTRETMDIPHTGSVRDCTNPGGLADAVVDLLLDETRRNEMGRAARQWTTTRFDWQRLTAEARAIFRDVAYPRRLARPELPLVASEEVRA
jgi:phosphatidylinositol alpha-1,6-mannosyltransferase